MKDIGKTVLEKIDTGQVKPYSRWHFVYKRSVIWGFFFISILLGSLATGTAIYQVKNAEWDMHKHFSHSFFEFLFIILPYFWIGFMVLFSVFAYYYYKRTEDGYKHTGVMIISGSVFLSGILGSILSITVIPERLDLLFENNIPFYRQIEMHRQKIWLNPENGFLAGSIKKVMSEEIMLFEDFSGQVWHVNIENTVFRGRINPEKGLKIKIIGEVSGKDRFVAYEVRPFRGKCRMRGQCGPMGKGKHMKKHRKFQNQGGFSGRMHGSG